jgi:lysozyme
MRAAAMKAKHKIGALTAAVIALAAGTATQKGFIPHWEGTKHVVSHNAFDPKGVWDVCYGHTNLDDPNLKIGDYYTNVMCSEILGQDLPKYNDQLASCLPKDFMVGDHQHVAMLSFIYNTGQDNFCNSSVGRAFRDGNRKAACNNMGKFTRAVGVVLKGLQNRRYDKFWGEIAWCLRED